MALMRRNGPEIITCKNCRIEIKSREMLHAEQPDVALDKLPKDGEIIIHDLPKDYKQLEEITYVEYNSDSEDVKELKGFIRNVFQSTSGKSFIS